jgi:recombination associated protein RdgC
MFYKNIFVYKLNEEKIEESKLQGLLEERKIVPCNLRDLKKEGWDEVLPGGDELFVKASGAFIVKMKTEEKVIPAVIIKEMTEKKIKATMKATGEKLSKDDKENIKENVIFELASKAFIKPSYMSGYVDFKNKLLVVDASSPSKADTFVSLLRETLGSLDAEILEPESDVVQKSTGWLNGSTLELPFKMGEGCTLKDFGGEGSQIVVSKQDLKDEEIKNHLNHGKMVDKIDLQWHDRVNFTLTSDFKIKKIKFSDVVTEQIKEDLGEDDDNYSQFVATMFMMIEDFAELINDLKKILK